MPSTTNVLDEARELLERRLSDLHDEVQRLERAIAELGGKVKRSPGRPRGSASTSKPTSAPKARGPKKRRRRRGGTRADQAVELFNRYSPRLAASLIAEDSEQQARFYARVDAPFVGDGFTRWVDGQYALGRPELGLSNWENGRLFARGGVLAGDGAFTVRSRMRQTDPKVRR